MEITITIPEDSVDLVCASHGWKEIIFNPSFNTMLPESDENVKLIPNPVSKERHLKDCLIRDIRERVVRHRLALAKAPIEQEIGGVSIT